MKKTLTLLFTLSITIGLLFSQNDCNPYFSLNKGKSWTTKSYSAKDKYQGKQSFEVTAVEEVNGVVISTIKLISFDKKDKEVFNNDITFECADGVLKMDMSGIVPEDMMQSFSSLDFEMTMDRMSIPKELYIGQKLDDGSLKMTMNGPIPMKLNVILKDRVVESKESLSVPAGDFETFKITYLTEFTGMGSRVTKNVEYISEGLGVVRSESYNKKGQLDYYSVLSSYSE